MKNTYKEIIKQMEKNVLEYLDTIEPDYCAYKYAISKHTGIPKDVLTIILRRLKYDQKISIHSTFQEWDGMISGSGYALNRSN